GQTQSVSFTQTMQYVIPQTSTAEWIVEVPTVTPAQPLANFGQVKFNGAWATIGTTTGPIDAFANNSAENLVPGGGTQGATALSSRDSNSLGFNEPSAGVSSSGFTVVYGNLPAGSYSTPFSDPRGNLFVLNVTSGNVYELAPGSGSTWAQIGSNISSLVYDPYGNIFALNSATGTVYELGAGPTWTPIRTNVSTLVSDKTDNVLALTVHDHGGCRYDSPRSRRTP